MKRHNTIQQAMRRNERVVLTRVRQANKKGELWYPVVLSHALFNAMFRLEEAGRIRYTMRRWVGGYRLVAPR